MVSCGLEQLLPGRLQLVIRVISCDHEDNALEHLVVAVPVRPDLVSSCRHTVRDKSRSPVGTSRDLTDGLGAGLFKMKKKGTSMDRHPGQSETMLSSFKQM